MADYRQAMGAMLAGAPQPSAQATGAPVPAGQPQAGGAPPANPAEMQDRAGGWMQFMEQVRNDPALLTAMMSMGGALMQNRPKGTSRAQQFAGAVGSGLELLGGAAGIRERFNQQDVVNKRADRALSETENRTALEKRRVEMQENESPSRIAMNEAQAKRMERVTDNRGSMHLQVQALADAYVTGGVEKDRAKAYIRAQEYLKDAARKSPEQMKAEIMGNILETSFPDDPGFEERIQALDAMVDGILRSTYPNYKSDPRVGKNAPRRAPGGGQAIFVATTAEAEKLPPGSYFYLPNTPPGKILRVPVSSRDNANTAGAGEITTETPPTETTTETEDNSMSLKGVLDRLKGNEFKGRLMD